MLPVYMSRGGTTWLPGLIKISGLRQLSAAMNTLANSILSRNTARRSAVEPHGVFNRKMKLRRATLTPINEAEGRGYPRWGCAQRDTKNHRGNHTELAEISM
jgi:hypothetical protein